MTADQNNLQYCVKGATPILEAHKEGDVHHTFIIGTHMRGKSANLEGEAERLGISYDEMLKRMEPTPEQHEAVRMCREQRKHKEAARLSAVREAFWAGTDDNDSEFDNLHDALISAKIVEEPTPTHVKALFMMLPDTIIGQGIAWGFNDTEVRESIHRFVGENREAVAQRVAAA